MRLHEALDQHLDMHKFYQTPFGRSTAKWTMYGQLAQGDIDGKLENHVVDEYSANFCSVLADSMREAIWRGDTLFITHDMLEIIMQAAHDMPNDLILHDHDLLSRNGVALFETPLETIEINGHRSIISGFVWGFDPLLYRQGSDIYTSSEDKAGMLHTWWLSDGTSDQDYVNKQIRDQGWPLPPQVMSHYYPLHIGEEIISGEQWTVLPKDAMNSPHREVVIEFVRNFVKIIVATFILAQQNLAEVRKVNAPRAARKRAERYEWSDRSYVSVITLRRKSAPSGEEPRSVDWQHRWVVTGHWRKQWYPSTKTHAWKYIHEFIKGPEDKPIVRRERRIFNFKR